MEMAGEGSHGSIEKDGVRMTTQISEGGNHSPQEEGGHAPPGGQSEVQSEEAAKNNVEESRRREHRRKKEERLNGWSASRKPQKFEERYLQPQPCWISDITWKLMTHVNFQRTCDTGQLQQLRDLERVRDFEEQYLYDHMDELRQNAELQLRRNRQLCRDPQEVRAERRARFQTLVDKAKAQRQRRAEGTGRVKKPRARRRKARQRRMNADTESA
mmetsp:Transcript_24833/g.54475  ORF Transcript_24833/g.54475 Transcript_24833/m.54475 type:complete len:215 (+) Transcript_24833:74-718(+)